MKPRHIQITDPCFSPLQLVNRNSLPGPTITNVGQQFICSSCHIRASESLITGWVMLYRKIALKILLVDFSLRNLAECTPTTTSPFWMLCLCSSSSRWGKTCIQFIQQYVKKSRTSSFPLRWLDKVRGSATFNQFWSEEQKLHITLKQY